MTNEKLVSELEKLIEFGDSVHRLYQLEHCRPFQQEHDYLTELDPDDYDDQDRANEKERRQFLKSIEQLEKSLSVLGDLGAAYQKFYTKSQRVVAALAPERLDDFVSQYKRTRGELKSAVNYTILDGLNGIRHNYGAYTPCSAQQKIRNQLDILSSIKESIGSVLFEIAQTIQMDVFDQEIESAKYLAGRGHLRAAGAVAGVVLERHLKFVAEQHEFRSRKKANRIAEFNEFLKSAGVIDVVVWRRIQGLADIRNLCDHAKDRNPTSEDVHDLLSGVERILKSVV